MANPAATTNILQPGFNWRVAIREFLAGKTGADMLARANKLRDNDNAEITTGQNSTTQLCRLPVPADCEGRFFYKGRDTYMSPGYSLHNEAVATELVRKTAYWNSFYNHVPTAHVYDYRCLQDHEYMATEFLEGRMGIGGEADIWVVSQTWTFTQRRAFLRQWALFRLSMLATRSNTIGGCIQGPAVTVRDNPEVSDDVGGDAAAHCCVSAGVPSQDLPSLVGLEYCLLRMLC